MSDFRQGGEADSLKRAPDIIAGGAASFYISARKLADILRMALNPVIDMSTCISRSRFIPPCGARRGFRHL